METPKRFGHVIIPTDRPVSGKYLGQSLAAEFPPLDRLASCGLPADAFTDLLLILGPGGYKLKKSGLICGDNEGSPTLSIAGAWSR